MPKTRRGPLCEPPFDRMRIAFFKDTDLGSIKPGVQGPGFIGRPDCRGVDRKPPNAILRH
jgi:hypothetical protein